MTDFSFINDTQKKKETVTGFANSFYKRNLSVQAVANLAEKIAKHAAMLCVVVDGKVAGFIAYYRNDVSTKTAYITVVVVKADFRGKGLGTAMIEKVIDDCRESGFTNLRLEVDNGNSTAIHMYTKLGFRKEKETDNISSYYCLAL